MKDHLRRTTRLISALTGVMFIIIVIGSVVIVAQETVTGTWTADTRTGKPNREDSTRIQLNFSRKQGTGKSQHGSTFEYSDLQGLTRQQALSDGRVNFRFVREAGSIECEGTFTDGKGYGTFVFTPNMTFVQTMRSKGFDFERDGDKHGDGEDSVSERLMTAAFVNVTTNLADDLNSANFGKLYVGDLYKAAIFKIDGKFMAEMKSTGFPNMQMEDLVKARIFKIDAGFVKQMSDMGFANRDFENLVKFRIFKVTPEFLTELKAAGLTNLDSEEVVKCRIFKIDGEFVRKAKAIDPNITVEDLVKMKIGVYRRDKDTY